MCSNIAQIPPLQTKIAMSIFTFRNVFEKLCNKVMYFLIGNMYVLPIVIRFIGDILGGNTHVPKDYC